MELGGVEGTWRLTCPMPAHRIGRSSLVRGFQLQQNALLREALPCHRECALDGGVAVLCRREWPKWQKRDD